jgi:hypothetical protein
VLEVASIDVADEGNGMLEVLQVSSILHMTVVWISFSDAVENFV